MYRSIARIFGRLIVSLLGLAIFPNLSLAQTTSKADAQVQYVFGIPPWDVAAPFDGMPQPANPPTSSAFYNCQRQSFGASFDLYVDAHTCLQTGFSIDGPFFRDDLGVDSTGSVPPSGWYAGYNFGSVPSNVLVARCSGYVSLQGFQGQRLLCNLYRVNIPPPTAANENVKTLPSVPVTIDLTAGAIGNPTAAALVGTPVGGKVSGFPSTLITFTPDADFDGGSFQFTVSNYDGTSNIATATITLGSPPVDIAKNNGTCSCDTASASHAEGNPIHSGTGNKFQTETDFTADPHTQLALTRYYNSQDTTASAFGHAWHSTWHHSLSVNSNVVTVTRADGRQDVFTNNGAGVYTADPDVRDRLSPVPATNTQTGWELLKADDSIETYTLAGQLTSITTRAGLVTNLTYDSNGRLIKVTGPFGHTLTFTNDSNDRVSQMVVPDGGVYIYAYSSTGNLTSVTYPGGAQRQYLYENISFPNALTGIIDENNQRFATWAYDAQGRAVSSQHAGGVELTTIAYNSDGSSTVTDANGNQHTYSFTTQFGVIKPTSLTGAPVPSVGGSAFTYDSNGFIASRTDYDGNVTTYTHDARGNETSRVMASGTPQARTITTIWDSTFNLPTQITDGNQVTTFTYDANGNLLSKTLTAAGATRTWSYTYNSTGQVLTATDPAGHVTSYAYDAQGNLAQITNALGQVTRFTSYDANGRPLQMQDPNGLVTSLAYNFRGQVTTKTEGQWVTIYAYDAAGQLTGMTRPDHSFVTLSYDAAHRLTGIGDALGNQTLYTLDANSNRTGVQVFAASGALAQKRSYAYDNVNRLSQMIGALGQTTNYVYDPNGNLTQVTDPLGHATSAFYDALDRRISTVDPNGGTIGFGYDSQSRLAGVTDPRGLVTSYGYDGLNDITLLTSPDTGATAKTFDAAGNVLTSTDALGNTTTYTYDALNRVTRAAFADGTVTIYQYDQGANGIGRLTSMSDSTGTTTWTYDIHGRVTSKRQQGAGFTLTTSMTYNATTGQLTSVTYPSGSTLLYAYDANGKVSGISLQPPRGAAIPLLSQIAYQPFGSAMSWRLGNGATYSRTFDQDGRVAKLALPSSDAVALTYDAASRITGLAETGLPAKAFGYDALDRIVSYASGTNTQTYGYDASGNRTAFTERLPPLADYALTYSYDPASNRLLGVDGSWQESFAYDANGNMVSHVTPWTKHTYEYDARNRRSRTYVGAIDAETDRINGLGERTVQTQQREGMQRFVYDEAGHLTGTYNRNGGDAQETVWLGDLPIVVLSQDEPFTIASDHLGAPHQITNARSHVVWQWDHDPFGNGQPTGTFDYRLRFPGQVHDQTAGLNYNYFRDYDPRTGRYTQSDLIGLAGGINTYSYVKQNPLSSADSIGLVGYTPPGADPNLCTKYDCKCATAECAAGLPQAPTNTEPQPSLECEVKQNIALTTLCLGLDLAMPELGVICNFTTTIGPIPDHCKPKKPVSVKQCPEPDTSLVK
jgi:RHS repeat-associated protein